MQQHPCRCRRSHRPLPTDPPIPHDEGVAHARILHPAIRRRAGDRLGACRVGRRRRGSRRGKARHHRRPGTAHQPRRSGVVVVRWTVLHRLARAAAHGHQGLVRTRPPGLVRKRRIRSRRGCLATALGGGLPPVRSRGEARVAAREGRGVLPRGRLGRAWRLYRNGPRQLGSPLPHHLGHRTWDRRAVPGSSGGGRSPRPRDDPPPPPCHDAPERRRLRDGRRRRDPRTIRSRAWDGDLAGGRRRIRDHGRCDDRVIGRHRRKPRTRAHSNGLHAWAPPRPR